MTRVTIVSDILNLGLPVGKEAYIIARDRRIDVAFQYLIRVPVIKKEFWVVENDIKPLTEADTVEDYSREAEKVIIDIALQTKRFDIIKQLKGEKKAD
ncbi:ATPase [Microaerobacter geothermalis]|uniref:ATPase n=1 Tax=Microaerobacter geothermalis TaxID=674972 RepID=UPI001F1F1A6F|nr:ATPase [Microaerobacter geothermalis]